MTSAFRMGDGVLDKWKVFRRKSCDAIAMILKIDTDNEHVVLDGDFAETSPEVWQEGKETDIRMASLTLTPGCRGMHGRTSRMR